MSFCAGSMLERWRSCARALAGDRRGVAAVEFAIIAPLLLSLYFVTMEFSQGIETNKKVSRVGSMVADLVAQQQTISTTEIDAIMKIGEAILQPYNRSDGEIFITAIKITDEATPKVLVEWSRKLIKDAASAGDLANGTATTVPPALAIRGTFLIRVESKLKYEPVIAGGDNSVIPGISAVANGISMGETYYLRPRMSQTIPCTGC